MERLTKQRKYIIEAVKVLNHASLNDIYSYLLKNNLKISLATLYRNLSSLTKDNILRKVDASLNETNYELVSFKPLHDHFICLKCGKIIDIDIKNDNKNNHLDEYDLSSLKLISNSQISYRLSNYYGTCNECLLKNGKK